MSSMTTPSGYWGRYFLKELTMDSLGMEWANCFRTHNELTMGPLSILVFAPSVTDHRLMWTYPFFTSSPYVMVDPITNSPSHGRLDHPG